jgi:hypothetical protein
MDARTAWENLSLAIADLNEPAGDYELKLATAVAGVEILFSFSPAEILAEIRGSRLSSRALVSWLVFEGGRLPSVDPKAVDELRELYEASCPPGEGIIPAPSQPKAQDRLTPRRGRA